MDIATAATFVTQTKINEAVKATNNQALIVYESGQIVHYI